MPRDGGGEGKHRYLRPEVFIDNGEDAEADGEPYERYGYDLDVQGYGLVFAEVTDVRAELGVAHKPLIQARRTMHEAPRREQEQGRCGQ